MVELQQSSIAYYYFFKEQTIRIDSETSETFSPGWYEVDMQNKTFTKIDDNDAPYFNNVILSSFQPINYETSILSKLLCSDLQKYSNGYYIYRNNNWKYNDEELSVDTYKQLPIVGIKDNQLAYVKNSSSISSIVSNISKDKKYNKVSFVAEPDLSQASAYQTRNSWVVLTDKPVPYPIRGALDGDDLAIYATFSVTIDTEGSTDVPYFKLSEYKLDTSTGYYEADKEYWYVETSGVFIGEIACSAGWNLVDIDGSTATSISASELPTFDNVYITEILWEGDDEDPDSRTPINITEIHSNCIVVEQEVFIDKGHYIYKNGQWISNDNSNIVVNEYSELPDAAIEGTIAYVKNAENKITYSTYTEDSTITFPIPMLGLAKDPDLTGVVDSTNPSLEIYLNPVDAAAGYEGVAGVMQVSYMETDDAYAILYVLAEDLVGYNYKYYVYASKDTTISGLGIAVTEGYHTLNGVTLRDISDITLEDMAPVGISTSGISGIQITDSEDVEVDITDSRIKKLFSNFYYDKQEYDNTLGIYLYNNGNWVLNDTSIRYDIKQNLTEKQITTAKTNLNINEPLMHEGRINYLYYGAVYRCLGITTLDNIVYIEGDQVTSSAQVKYELYIKIRNFPGYKYALEYAAGINADYEVVDFMESISKIYIPLDDISMSEVATYGQGILEFVGIGTFKFPSWYSYLTDSYLEHADVVKTINGVRYIPLFYGPEVYYNEYNDDVTYGISCGNVLPTHFIVEGMNTSKGDSEQVYVVDNAYKLYYNDFTYCESVYLSNPGTLIKTVKDASYNTTTFDKIRIYETPQLYSSGQYLLEKEHQETSEDDVYTNTFTLTYNNGLKCDVTVIEDRSILQSVDKTETTSFLQLTLKDSNDNVTDEYIYSWRNGAKLLKRGYEASSDEDKYITFNETPPRRWYHKTAEWTYEVVDYSAVPVFKNVTNISYDSNTFSSTLFKSLFITSESPAPVGHYRHSYNNKWEYIDFDAEKAIGDIDTILTRLNSGEGV